MEKGWKQREKVGRGGTKGLALRVHKGESLIMETERDKGIGIASDDDDEGEHEELLGIKLRRVLAARKRGGPCTPSPPWKLEEEGEELEADAGAGPGERPREAARSKQLVSARKLGANLWEVQDFLPVEGMSRRSERPRHRGDGGVGGGVSLSHPGAADRPQSAGSLRRHIVASLNKHRQSGEGKNHALQPASPAAYSSSLEITPFKPTISPGSSPDLRGRNVDAGYGLKTSTELLNVLNHIWTLEEQHASNVSLVKALKVELDRARARIRELMQEQKAHHHEVDDLMNQVAKEKMVRKKKEQDRMKAAVLSMRAELDDERRLRRRSESLHHKLGKELSDTKAALSKALKDLENERESNGLLEELCDEFAKGIGKYEVEIRELKKRHSKDCERERAVDGLVLHISEAWLDERLQMQMAEFRGDQDEKGTTVSRLKAEIISFLQARQANRITEESGQQHGHNLRRQSLESLHMNGTVSAPRDIEDDDSVASDQHCFELNMDRTNKRIHDQLKSQVEISFSNLECARKSTSIRKTVGHHRSIKDKCLTMSHEEQLEGKELCNTTHLQTDANVGITEVDESEDYIVQKSTNSNSGRGQERNTDALDVSNLSTDNQTKNHLENPTVGRVHHVNNHWEVGPNKFSRRKHFLPHSGDNITGAFLTAASPMQQRNYSKTSADFDISEFSSKQPQGLTENTLKAKLLEARLEGRYARLKALKGASVAGIGQ